MKNRNTQDRESLVNLKKKKKESAKIRKTTQDTIPIVAVFRDGLFLEENHVFSKMYTFDDIAFTIKSKESQETIMKVFEQLLTAIPSEASLKFSVVITKTDTEKRILEVASQAYEDSLNEWREAYNDVIRSKMSASQVSLKKYITVSVTDDDMEHAESLLGTVEGMLRDAFVSLETQIYLISSEARLEILQQVLNQSQKNYAFEHTDDDRTIVDFKKLAKQGLGFKDIISPQYLAFKGSYFSINDGVGQSLYLNNIPNRLSTSFYTELSSLAFEGVVSYYITPKTAKEASKIIRDLSVGVQTEMDSKKDGPTKKSIAMSNELEAWASDIQERDQKMFNFDLLVTHFAEDRNALKKQEAKITGVADKFMGNITPCIATQERSFITSLPLGTVIDTTSRYLNTESLALFQPFDEVNTFQEGGRYYGINAINDNVVVINKLKNDNYNSVILGSSGSGKSFAVKQEITGVILNNPTASVFILDPEGEYSQMVERYGGAVVRIAPQSKTASEAAKIHLNACDLDIDTSLDPKSDPLAMKTDFICGLIETILGKNATLDAESLAIVTRCVDLMYEPYIDQLSNRQTPDGKPVTIDREICPTLQKLFDLLLRQPEPAAHHLAKKIEPFVVGLYSIFAHTTNVDIDNRIICYDLSGISGDKLMNLALKVCLDDFWSRTLANRRRGRWTYIYADEAHRFFENPTSASYFEQFWRRLRKWNGVPTAITQNPSDLLVSEKACLLLTQSSNIMILRQQEREQMVLKELLNLHPSELAYIKKPKPGSGLIINNGFVIPFINEFPEDNPLFPLFSTKDAGLAKKDA